MQRQRRGSLIATILTAIATMVIAFGTIRYWITTKSMLSQMRDQTQQTADVIATMEKSNRIMEAAYAETKTQNKIIQTQLEIGIEQYFEEKQQHHYELKQERDRVVEEIRQKIAKKELPDQPLEKFSDFTYWQNKLEANYEALQSLVKRYAPLGGKLAKLEKELPPKEDLTPRRRRKQILG